MSRKVSLIALALLAAVAATTATAYTLGGLPNLGPSSHAQVVVYKGYYDGHLDKYLVLDVSSKAQAAALHINYSPGLGHVKGAPPQYFFQGTAAPGQVSVFGLTEPGKPNYTPLWDEYFVTWKAGVTPVLLKVDDDITAAAKAGKLTIRDAHIVLNAPIISVGK
jgi:hypothetical protein